jgi:RNA recognition motif-containing protein
MAQGGKLFLGGLPQTVATPVIEEYFRQFGNVTDAVVMPGRGFGFVTFETVEMAQEVLQHTHVVEGRTVDVKMADMNKGGGKGQPPMQLEQYEAPSAPFVPFNGPSASPAPSSKGGKGGGKGKGGLPPGSTDKIFIGGLPADIPDDAVRNHFEAYGELIDFVVMKDKATGKPRGFGFVQYDNTDSADRVMDDYSNHEIGGKWIECKRATPQDQMSKGKGRSSPAGPPMAYGGGGYGCANPYGAYGSYPQPVYGAPPMYGGYCGGYCPQGGYGPPPGAYGPPPGAYGMSKGKGYAPY